jgi:hypothetical protein
MGSSVGGCQSEILPLTDSPLAMYIAVEGDGAADFRIEAEQGHDVAHLPLCSPKSLPHTFLVEVGECLFARMHCSLAPGPM